MAPDNDDDSSVDDGEFGEMSFDVANVVPTATPGALVFPVGGKCAFIDTYGAARGGGRSHEGVDIIAPQGKPVYAVTAGTISRMSYVGGGTNTLGGNSLHLRSNDGTGTYYYYAHFVAFAPGIQKGVTVAAGQLVGFVGMTGNASGPHLHFEVHPNGGASVNPYPFVKAVDACKIEVTSPVWDGVTPPPVSVGGGSTGSPTTWVSGPMSVARGVVPTRPERLVDSRINQGISGALSANVPVTVVAAGRAGVPANADLVHVNVVAVEPGATGQISIVPCGSGASTTLVTFQKAATIGTTAVVGLSGGSFCLVSTVKTHVVIDVMGYRSAGAGTGYVQMMPVRSYDSRLSGGRALAAGEVRSVKVVGFPGIPSEALAASLNVTIVGPAKPGFLTAWPCGAGQTNTSVLNFAAGQTIGNAINVAVGTNGSVCFFSNTSGHLVVDLTGVWMGGSGQVMTTGTPTRILDTRAQGQRLSGHATKAVTVTGVGGVPAGAKSVVLSVTALGEAAPGFITAWPCGQKMPTTSSLNFGAGQTTSNTTIQAVGSEGRVCFFSNTDTDLLVDVQAYTAP